MTTTAITVDRLTKRYGAHLAVDDISFEVAKGEVVGFLGPNGAGKSTTLRILAGFIGATSGRAVICGHDVVADSYAARRATGYMPEAVPLYGEMRVAEYLRFRAELKLVPRKERVASVGRAMELAHVSDVADTRIEHLSKGYRQRVGLADALVARPPLLVLDEPTAGMDPNQIRDVREMVAQLAGEQTVLISTHILSEVEAICPRVLVISQGRLVAQGSLHELGKQRSGDQLEFVLRGDPTDIRAAVGRVPGMSLVELTTPEVDGVQRAIVAMTAEGLGDNANSQQPSIETSTELLVATLVAERVAIRRIVNKKTSLEDVFASLTSDSQTDPQRPMLDGVHS